MSKLSKSSEVSKTAHTAAIGGPSAPKPHAEEGRLRKHQHATQGKGNVGKAKFSNTGSTSNNVRLNSPETPDVTRWCQPADDEFPISWLACAAVGVPHNSELEVMFQEDQADRMPESGRINWDEVGPRDDERRERVLEILDASECRAPLDFYHAAFMCHHAAADQVWFYQAANFLALKAVQLCPEERQYRWLFAAAKDRLLKALGKPQIFGIQGVCKRNAGKPTREWWIPGGVEPWATDSLRREWGSPTMQDRERRLGRRCINKE